MPNGGGIVAGRQSGCCIAGGSSPPLPRDGSPALAIGTIIEPDRASVFLPLTRGLTMLRRGAVVSFVFAGSLGAIAPHLAAQATPVPPQSKPSPADTSVQTIALEFDQKSRLVRIATPADPRGIIQQVDAHTFRLTRSAQIEMRVVNTNTATYDVTVTDSVAPPVPGQRYSGDLSAFLSAAHPLFPALASGLSTARMRGAATPSILPPAPPSSSREGAIARTLAVAKSMESDVAAADSLINGPHGVVRVHDAVVTALSRLRGEPPETVAADFRQSLGVSSAACARVEMSTALGFSSRLQRVKQSLRPRADSLARGLSDAALVADSARAIHDTLQWFYVRADSVIRASDAIAPTANQTENLATIISGACSGWKNPQRKVLAGSSRVFYVQVQPRSEPELGQAAVDPPMTAKVSVLPPKPFITPSFGASVLASPSARYPVYGTRTPATPAGIQAEVFQPSTLDARYTWGVTVGAGWRPLDWRESSGLAIWLPELTILPSGTSGLSSVGFASGGALSYQWLKLGAGFLFVQHSVLDGQNVGQVLPNKDFLKQRNSYGGGSFYLSLSVFDVPTFMLPGH